VSIKNSLNRDGDPDFIIFLVDEAFGDDCYAVSPGSGFEYGDNIYKESSKMRQCELIDLLLHRIISETPKTGLVRVAWFRERNTLAGPKTVCAGDSSDLIIYYV